MERMVPVSEARARFADLLDELEEHDVVLVRHSRPAGVLVSPERWEDLHRRIRELDGEAARLYAEAHPEDRVSVEELRSRSSR